MTRVTSHPPLARQPISCYYYACDLSYFDVVLCPSSSQILATPLHQEVTFSYQPRPPQCSLEFPKSPPQKNPGSANAQTDGHTRLRYVDIVYITVGCPSVCPFVCLFIYSPIHIKKQNTTSQDTYTLKRIKQLSGLNGQHCPGDNSCRSIHICRRHKSASTSWQRQCCDPRRIDTQY